MLADFIVETTIDEPNVSLEWTLFVDGSSNMNGSGGRFLLDNDHDLILEVILRFDLPTSNKKS